MKKILGLLLVASLTVGCTGQAPPAVAISISAAQESPAGRGAVTTSLTTAAAPGPTTTPTPVVTVAAPTFSQMLGQKLVVRMQGTTPSADLLGRIRRGEIGGVILFGANVTTKSALIALTAKLRAAAVAGGQPHFLIATDQEGGSVKRIPWAPPTLSPPQMGRLGSTSTAHTQGVNTGAALRGLGINVDFAPVADVATTESFIYKQGRTWSFSAKTTAALADAFASGLVSKRVAPSMKHFPGLAFATRNTDSYVVRINYSKTRLAPGLRPYQTAIAHHIPLIMLSNATYPAYDSVNAAGWSHAISVTLLRHDLGFTGVTITDSLSGTAAARGVSTTSLALKAAQAGTDMILVSGTEASTKAMYATLLRDARAGLISATTLRTSYDRILAFKASL